jgi:NAD-dependent dihydropyrimidine dehydrogenase PreA subunit
MSFMITPQCSGKDTICEDICAYDCIKTVDATPPNDRHYFQIDTQHCTNCGACAAACTENAIVFFAGACPRHEPSRPSASAYSTSMIGSLAGWDRGSDVPVNASSKGAPASNAVLPEGLVLVNGKIESWARLMAAMSD